jgi:benzoyl-CoA reductase subunit D
MAITAGIDIGTGAVKTVIFDVQGEKSQWLARRVERIRQRNPYQLAEQTYDELLEELGLKRSDVAYVATTGEGESLEFHTGHFYSMTTHGRGAIYFEPEARAVLDIGALHGRGIKIDNRGKVVSYKMTSQCASGSGQFLENIARYLGIAQDEIGPLSQQADKPEKVSSICAVLAETDVINMVSRGLTAPNILKGIHQSMAIRLVKLLKSIEVGSGVVLMTGGLASDTGLVAAMREAMVAEKVNLTVKSHPDSIYAGAVGAALWGGFRHEKLTRMQGSVLAGVSAQADASAAARA